MKKIQGKSDQNQQQQKKKLEFSSEKLTQLPEKVMELNALPESLTESLSEKPSFRYPAQNKAPAEKICVWLQRFNFQIRFASESR